MSRLEMLLQLLQERPNDSFARFALAKEYEKQSELPSALENYLALRQSDPAYVGLYYHLGKLYELLEQPETAIEVYRAGMEVAKSAKDMHALGELNGARMQIDDED